MKKIGFIGAGNMATAIIKGIIARNGNADNINVFDVSEEKQNLMKELGAAVCGSCADVTAKSDIIVLAGKGHETYQILDTGTIHLDEREVVAEALKEN